MNKPELTVGICAYNEEKNIEALISQMLGQKIRNAELKEVLVVSSGSTDRTVDIVRKIAARDGRVRLLIEGERKGKSSAVNLILKEASGHLITLSGADLQIPDDVIEKLVRRLFDERVGMVGARPVPVNDKNTFSGFCSHLLWDLHHRISLKSPKCGELIAFRNKHCVIPEGIGADEAYLESFFRKEGLSLAYADDAIVRNRGPETIQDYVKQRRRIHSQHMHLARNTGYKVSTGHPFIVVKELLSTLKPDIRLLVFTAGAATLEGLSFMLGAYDFHIAKNTHKSWDMVQSTKEIR